MRLMTWRAIFVVSYLQDLHLARRRGHRRGHRLARLRESRRERHLGRLRGHRR